MGLMKKIGLAAVALGLGIGQGAQAGDSNGDFQVKAGITGVIWQDENRGINTNALGGLFPVPGADAHAKDVLLPTATLTYFMSKNVSAELFCCFGHVNVYTTGTLNTNFGQSKVADTWVFPPILTLQYRFDPIGQFRPYVGIGAQWVHYFREKSDLNGAFASFNKVDFKDSFGLALQTGFDYDLGAGWSFGFDVKKVFEDTKITWTSPTNTITTRHDLDPLLLTANIGYRFNLSDIFGSRSSPAPLK